MYERLAIFLPELYGAGAQRVMLNLAKGLAGKGYSVDLIVAQALGQYLSEVPESVRLIDLKSKRVLTSLPALVHYLNNEQPAALLSSLHANIVAVWAKHLSRFPHRVVVSQHDTSSITNMGRVNLKTSLMPLLVKLFYPWADGIVAVSKGVADGLAQITGIPREKIRVIYNPVITPDLQEKTKEPIDHPWFKNGKPPVLLGVGSLSKNKDFSTLIQAYALVRETRPVRLLILGEGDERQALEELIRKLCLQNDINLPGFIHNPYPFMAHSSVFILSSVSEGLPTVLVEAMCCGTPVIATDCPSGPREILSDGKYGQLVPIGDVDSMARAIINALDGETPFPIRESLLSYDIELVVNQYVDILLEG